MRFRAFPLDPAAGVHLYVTVARVIVFKISDVMEFQIADAAMTNKVDDTFGTTAGTFNVRMLNWNKRGGSYV
jgi:hypothetical protein